MKKFKYKARDAAGNEVKGEVEATSESVAARLVRDRGYVLTSLSPVRGGVFSFYINFRSRVSAGQLTSFTRQLATMVNAGLPVTESLSILRLQSEGSLRPVVSQILADVEGGQSLSKAMGNHTRVFNKSYIALVKSGETGGVLDKVLARLADDMEKSQEFKGKVKGAMIYPIIIVIGMVVVSVIMMVFIMPRLTDLYSQFNVELPFITKVLIGFSNFLIHFWFIAVAIIGGIIWMTKLYLKTKSGQHKAAELLFKVPILGPLQKEIILTEITRTMSLMVGSGVPILDGLRVTTETVSNPIIHDSLVDAAEQIEKGFPISYSFAQHPEAFPVILAQMISVGEETGKMEEVLAKVSHVFEVDSEQKVKALTSAIEPLIMIILGLGVGVLVVSVILPIYNLTTAI